MADYETYTLRNGLRLIHAPSHGAVTYCGLSVAAGSRDERPAEQGMAHFVEHTIFKGTVRRKAWHILNRMENVGGELNAYTNKEETVIYSTFLTRHLERAMELLSDIVFHPTFPQRELDKEKGVIIDEINMYEDSPAELIYDEFEALLFDGHPLGRGILGTPATLQGFTSADVLDFVSRYYSPSNMVLFVRGDVDFARVRALAVKYFEPVADHVVTRDAGKLPPYVPFHTVRTRDLHQAHVMLGCRAYDAHDSRRTALYLLTNILGGPGMNSRLNVELREKRGLVYNVEANLVSYKDTGTFTIYFASDAKDCGHCLDIVRRQLQLLRDKRLGTMSLAMAKKQLIGQIGVASDNNENCALDMAKSYLHYGKVNSAEEIFARIESVSVDDVLMVANDRLDEGRLSLLAYDQGGQVTARLRAVQASRPA